MKNQRSHILSLVIALAATCIVLLYFRKWGFFASYDSGWYLLVADSFRTGIFERNVRFAPLYSWTLGILKLSGLPYRYILYVYIGGVFFGLIWFSQLILDNIFLALICLSSILFNRENSSQLCCGVAKWARVSEPTYRHG